MIAQPATRVAAAEWVALSILIPCVTLCYALNWYPGPGGRVWYGDSVGFQYWAISNSLGHSPGYPQYLALIRAVARVPMGQAWQRVDFVSSLFGALALGAYYLLNRTLGLPIKAACVASVLLGLSRTFFTQATEAEVYTLNALWVFSCIALFAAYLTRRQLKILVAFFVTFGFALGHHPTAVLLVLPVAISIFLFDRRLLLDWRLYAASALAIAIGVAQYIYTYRLFVQPKLDFRWDEYAEHNLATFIDYTSGGPFRGRLFSQPLSHVANNALPKLIEIAHAQNSLFIAVIGLIGLAVSRSLSTSHRVLLLLCTSSYVVWALCYDVSDIEAFCTLLWAMCSIGVAALIASSRGRLQATASLLFVLSALLAFQRSVVATGEFRPTNDRLSAAYELISKVPAGAGFVGFKYQGNSALTLLLRYLEASGESQVRVLRTVKHCDSAVYFTPEAGRSIRVKHYKKRLAGHLDRLGQDLYAMLCD